MSRRYSESELTNLYRSLGGAPSLLVPAGLLHGAAAPLGPAFHVRVTYAEYSGRQDAAAAYWTLLNQTPPLNMVGILSSIINLLASQPVLNSDVQQELEACFASEALRKHIRDGVHQGRASSVLFNHLSALLAIAHVIGVGNQLSPAPPDTAQERHKTGELFLFANQFFDSDPLVKEPLDDEQMMLIFASTWDLLNRRDLAYTMTRMYEILSEAMKGTSPKIADLRKKLFGNTLPTVNGMSVEDFRAIIFALFAWAQSTVRTSPRLFFDQRTLLQNFPLAEPSLNNVVAARAKGLDELRAALGVATDTTGFESDLKSVRFLANRVNVFREFPMLRLDDNQFAILDLQFLAELLSQGVYWAIFKGLPGEKRGMFREMWGHAFERYTINLLEHFYPPPSGCLRAGILYAGGEVDALLDFGRYVVPMEIKSSLLTETAKRGGNLAALLADVDKKFVRDEYGDPKAVVQLASATKAIRRGLLNVTIPNSRIYPVLVTDEVCVEAPGFNSYLNAKFNAELTDNTNVAPLTVLSIGELEELLPYLQAGRFDLATLLSARFVADKEPPHELKVHLFSVHQTLYDLPGRGDVLRNDFLLEHFKNIRRDVYQLFGPAAP